MFNAELLCMKCMKGMVSGQYCGFCGSPRSIVQERDNVLPLRTILNGRYLVGSMLGAGGFGVTYMGYDLAENKRIAIKEFMPNGMVHRKPGDRTVLRHNQEEYASSMDRFLEEARIIYHYQRNPHILQVYSLFKENGTAYYVMEFLEGTDLKHLLKKRGGRMSWQELLPITMQIIDALAVLHKDGVVHRDISPDNIFVGPGGRTTLIDFGAARLYMAQKQLTVILKRKYAPIEQYESKGKQGPWTDIYALAATLYHCLTGCLPPEATERAYRDELKSFKQQGISLEPTVESAIYRAMRVEPGERYRNIMEFREDLLGRQKSLHLVGVKGVYKNAKIEISGLLTVGRNTGCCQLIYSDTIRGISSIHCQFRGSQGGLCIEVRDMGSTYGTWVNGIRLEGERFYRLSSGDTVHFGEEQIWRVEGS